MQAICKPDALALLACCSRIPFVFSSCSLGILLVFCPSIPPAIPAPLLQASRAGAAL
jgi:hypothetical protein